MSFDNLLVHEITISNLTVPDPDDVDRYGNPVEENSAPVTVPARVEPLASDEFLANRDTIISTYRCFLLPTAPITATSVVVFNCDTYRVKGEPARFPGRTADHHLEAILERVEG